MTQKLMKEGLFEANGFVPSAVVRNLIARGSGFYILPKAVATTIVDFVVVALGGSARLLVVRHSRSAKLEMSHRNI